MGPIINFKMTFTNTVTGEVKLSYIYSYVHMKPLLGLFMKGNGYFSKWDDSV